MSDQFGTGKPASHRASYILEFGTWRATCRVCGFSVTSPQRRQTATQFRTHIRDFRVSEVIDLTTPAADAAHVLFTKSSPGLSRAEGPQFTQAG